MKNFNQKGISSILLIVIIIVAVVGSVGVYLYIQNKSPEAEIDNKAEESIEEKAQGTVSFKDIINECNKADDPLKEMCIRAACEAVGTIQEKINKCLAIDDVSFDEENIHQMRDDCLNFISPKTMEVCDAMHSTTGSYNSPKDGCYLSIAEETGSKLACDRMKSDLPRRNLCYKKVARIKKDSGTCEGIQNEEYKKWCLAVATGDLSKCDDIGDSEYSANDGNIKGNCYLEISEDKNDISICDKIDWDNSYQESCYWQFAREEKDTSLCDKLEEPRRSNCYSGIEVLEAIEKDDYSICEKEETEIPKNVCYYRFAEEKKDISLCSRISSTGGDVLYYCYYLIPKSIGEELNQNLSQEEISLYDQYCGGVEDETEKEKAIIKEAKEIVKTTGDIDKAANKCKEISVEWSEESYVYCITEIAIEGKDASACEKYVEYPENTTGLWRYTCYDEVAMAINDFSICHLIKGSSADGCYLRLAFKNNDPSICEFIPEDRPGGRYYDRGDCYRFIEEGEIEY